MEKNFQHVLYQSLTAMNSFAPKMEMAYNTNIELVRQGKKNISHRKPK